MLKTVIKINKNLQNAVRDECDRKKSVCVIFKSKNCEGKNFLGCVMFLNCKEIFCAKMQFFLY